MRKRFLVEEQRANFFRIINKYVSDERVLLKPVTIKCEESFSGSPSKITCKYQEGSSKKTLQIQDTSVIGPVFDSLIEKYSDTYKSLRDIKFVNYSVHPFFEGRGRNSNAMAEVILEVSSVRKDSIPFRSKDVSVLRASISCVFSCVEYYINSEICFKKLKFLIEDAKSRGRSDIMQIYVSDISEMVKNNSYEGID
tara:strand:- start:8234 stop:8821 length:588 start_codon:yes stop_codon:yes gene_type:complete